MCHYWLQHLTLLIDLCCSIISYSILILHLAFNPTISFLKSHSLVVLETLNLSSSLEWFCQTKRFSFDVDVWYFDFSHFVTILYFLSNGWSVVHFKSSFFLAFRIHALPFLFYEVFSLMTCLENLYHEKNWFYVKWVVN